MQEMAEELGEDDELLEEQQELLNELHEHPIDLNHTTRSELLTLPFLTETAVDGILNYLAINGPMRSLGELQFITQLGLRERQWLRLFATISDSSTIPTTPTSWWGRDRHELLVRTDIPLYERAGWSWAQGIGQRWRYTWQQGKHIDFGLRAENDAGEPLFNRENPFFDSYGGHVMLRNLGPVQTIIVGDYKLGFGEGLVVNKSLRLGKMTSSLWRTPNQLRPHRSADEVNYLRGIAASFVLGQRWTATAFYSRRKLDASVKSDNTISTLSTSGLHRTASELAHKAAVGSQTTGFHVASEFTTANTALNVGATALYQYFDHQFRQDQTPYRQIYPEGYQFGAASIDYALHSSRLLFGGETAHSFDARGGGWSTLNKAVWRFSPNTQLAAIHRFYSKNYYSPHASAFGENSRVQNESGATLLLDADRIGPLSLHAFVDYFYSPWPRYTMTRSSHGWEANLQATYAFQRNHSMVVRYSFKSKERSDVRHLTHRLRATYAHTFSPRISGQLATFLALSDVPSSAASESRSATGYALMPRINFTSRSECLRLALTTAIFHAVDYDARLFVYEPALFQSFGLQQFYGRGQRLATTLRFLTPNRRWTLQAKAGITHYSDRSEISSGFLRINSSWKTDIQLLLRLRM